MKIKKIKINGYDVFIYKTKKYSSIHMRFLFEMPYTRENIFKCDLLEEYQIHSLAKYKTRKELFDRRMELYSIGYGLHNYNIGEKMFTEATFDFYDPALVKDNYLRDALEFAREVLMYPNFEDGKLDETELRRCKDNLINSVSDELLDYGARVGKSFIETLYPNTYKTVDKISSKEEYVEIIESISEEDLIAMHHKLVHESLVGLVIMGNVTDEMISLIEELFKFDTVREIDKNYNEYIPFAKNLLPFNHIVDEDYKESTLRVVYSCPSKSLKDKVIYSLIARMMDANGLLIFKTLREELGIVYSAGAGYNRKLDYIVAVANIDAKNLDAARDGFRTVFKKMEDRELIEKLLAKVKAKDKLNEYVFDESKWNVFYELYDLAFDFDISMKKRVKIASSVTVDDIMIALSKMREVTVHFYEGAKK